jgi:hypothetical protein
MSLIKKYGKNGTYSIESFPNGVVEPSICTIAICSIEIAAITNGKTKCKLKNLFKVLFETEKPPHSHSEIISPITGIAVNKFVITVAAQKLIWPQGNIYPMNAVAIIRIKIIHPVYQAKSFAFELRYTL